MNNLKESRQVIPQVKEILKNKKIEFSKLDFSVNENNKDYIYDIQDTITDMKNNT
jgi:hypothetical protein